MAVFLGGFALGRNSRTDRVQISYLQPSAPPTVSDTLPAETRPSETTPPETVLININTAGVDVLDTLPGIGPVLARRIIEYREANGPFSSIEDLMNVSGIGEKKFDALKELITAGGME